MAELFVVPKLEEVAAEDGATDALDMHTAILLETTAIAALSALVKRRLALATETRTAIHLRRYDRLLRVKEVADRIGMSTGWVYHHQHQLPFRVPLATVPRFSERGLEEFIRKRQGS
jgi:predicted DNA-binding transcriptional regulator AlpA